MVQLLHIGFHNGTFLDLLVTVDPGNMGKDSKWFRRVTESSGALARDEGNHDDLRVRPEVFAVDASAADALSGTLCPVGMMDACWWHTSVQVEVIQMILECEHVG